VRERENNGRVKGKKGRRKEGMTDGNNGC